MTRPYQIHAMATINWYELMNAIRAAADDVPAGQCTVFDAERLEYAARVIRKKAAKHAADKQVTNKTTKQ